MTNSIVTLSYDKDFETINPYIIGSLRIFLINLLGMLIVKVLIEILNRHFAATQSM